MWKRKGDVEVCSNSRGILVSDVSGNCFYVFLRKALLPIFNASARSLQCGGRRGMGAVVCGHIPKLMYSCCANTGNSLFMLFVDVVGAFDAVVRELVFTDQIL